MIYVHYGIKDFSPTQYTEYLCSVSCGRKDIKVAREMTSDAIKYLATVPSWDCRWEDYFLDVHCLRNYIDGLQQKCLGTVAEEIR